MAEALIDDPNQPLVYIPFNPDSEEPPQSPPSQFTHRDLPNGYDLRLSVYADAWSKCFNRVQSIIHALHSPVANNILDEVRKAHEDTLPGLPYPEIPVICVEAPSASPTFLDDITTHLETSDDTLVTHLWPPDCTNLTTTMKAIISGFVDRETSDGLKPPRRKPATSLASYDISVLVAWFQAHHNAPGLVILLHDFEQFDPSIIQDVFEICSLHIKSLPLTFLISLSSPSPSRSHLHAAYPRSILALLRIKTFNLPAGGAVLEEILLKTFFDPSYAPPLTIGPSVLDFVIDYFTRHNSSLDALLTVLQLVHVKHFTDPLTVLCLDSHLGTSRADLAAQKLTEPSSFGFLDSLLTRLLNVVSKNDKDRWQNQTIIDLISSIDTARLEFHVRARATRVGFRLLLTMQRCLKAQGYNPFASAPLSIIEMIGMSMRGKMTRQIKWVGTLIRKLAHAKLEIILDEMATFFASLEESEEDEEGAGTRVGEFIDLLAASEDEGIGVREEVGTWFVEYTMEAIAPLDESCVLWDVWYTGMTPFPSELLNPNVRASVVSGLLNPFAYLRPPFSDAPEEKGDEIGIHDLPDTSILFHRYLECGKLINVWDWFQSFALVCEGQREREREREQGRKAKANTRTLRSDAKEPRSPRKKKTSPTKTKTPTKGKGKGKEKELPPESEDEVQEEDEESWKLQIQARFMRALHELDLLGFIKHTGRKMDHVMRTVWLGEV